MPTWLVTLRDALGKQWSQGVSASSREHAEKWALRWAHEDRRGVSVVASRTMTEKEESEYGGAKNADAPGELPDNDP